MQEKFTTIAIQGKDYQLFSPLLWRVNQIQDLLETDLITENIGVSTLKKINTQEKENKLLSLLFSGEEWKGIDPRLSPLEIIGVIAHFLSPMKEMRITFGAQKPSANITSENLENNPQKVTP